MPLSTAKNRHTTPGKEAAAPAQPIELPRAGTRARARLLHGDSQEILAQLKPASFSLVITSPPYFIGKEYDSSKSADEFQELHRKVIPQLVKLLKPGGHLCFQVGYHVDEGAIVPLDFLIHEVAKADPELALRNRIVWMFRHGANCSRRFSGRHETILWYTKGDKYDFHLDAVRVPQLYPGKLHYKGPKKGKHSGNPLGKNPSDFWDDVWDIPNVKAKHPEKTSHPCQFPTALVRRLVRALTKKNDWVLDPFLGAGSSGVSAVLEKRRFVGIDRDGRYLKLAKRRIKDALAGKALVRADVAVRIPRPGEAVSKRPKHFRKFRKK